MSISQKYKIIIFDLDMTLIDTSIGSSYCYDKAFQFAEEKYYERDLPLYMSEFLDKTYSRLSSPKISYKEFETEFYRHSHIRYVEYGVLIENKIDELSKLCRSSLFDFEINSNVIYVRTLNDFNVREIIKDDFVFIDKSNRKHNVQEIGDCALANCKFLETIEAPPTLNYLGCYVFAKCYNLNFVKMNGLIGIGDGAFFRCSHLTEISFPHLTKVGHFSFYYCVNLLRINAPSLEEIWDYAFCGCDLIKSASFKKVRIIGNFAFDSCTGLKKIYLKEVKEIWSYSFCNCWGLKDIYYEGTIQQWVLVNKHNNWDYGTGNYIVHCLDGNIVKEKV